MKGVIFLGVLFLASASYAEDLIGQKLVGGMEKVESPEMVETLSSFINEHRYNLTGVNDNVWLVRNISNVTSQVVSGMIWRLEATLEKTTCLREAIEADKIIVKELSMAEARELCGVHDSNATVVLNYKILTKPWLDLVQVQLEEIKSGDESVFSLNETTTTAQV